MAPRACGLVVDTPNRTLSLPQWVVPDTTEALGQIALVNRERFAGPAIAITGSSGKTTVKEMTAAILSRCGPTLATRGNLNNHIGVPLTLLGLAPEHRYAVIEMGASAAGEIASYCRWARPDVALVNNIGAAHLAGFGSLEGTARAKGEIYRGLGEGGVAVVNLDEPFAGGWLDALGETVRISYGVAAERADVRARDIRMDEDGCCHFVLDLKGETVAVSLPLPGRHNVHNALAAAACALAVGAPMARIGEGLAQVSTVGGRMRVCTGAGGARLIDDSYNANPGSVRAAIDTLARFDGRRVLVLGDMGELGASEAELHREVGEYARQQGIDELWAVGRLSAYACVGFAGAARHFEDRNSLAVALRPLLEPTVTVLVKGSRSAGMEAVVAALTEENT